MKRSVLVRDYMLSPALTLSPDMSLLQAAHLLIESGAAGAPVVDKDGWPIGMLTEQDCIEAALQAYYHGVPGGPVGSRMSRNPVTIVADDSILDAAQLFIRNRHYGYPVVTGDGRLVGLLRRKDLLRAFGEFYPK